MSESAQVIRKLQEYLQQRNAPLTTENLNRASLAIASQRDPNEPEVELDLEGDRVNQRTQRVVEQARTGRSTASGTVDSRSTPARGATGEGRERVSRPSAPATPTGATAPRATPPVVTTPPVVVPPVVAEVPPTTTPPPPAKPTDPPRPIADQPPAPTIPPLDLTGEDQPVGTVRPAAAKDTGLDPENQAYTGRAKASTSLEDTMREAPQGAREAKEEAITTAPTNAAELARLQQVDPPINSTVSPLDLVGGLVTSGGRAILPALVRAILPKPVMNTGPLREPPVAPPSGAPPTGPRPATRERLAPHPSVIQTPGRPVAPGLGNPASPATTTEGPANAQGELLEILKGFTRTRGEMPSAPTAPPVQVTMGPPPNRLPPHIGVPGNRLTPPTGGTGARPAGGGEMPRTADSPYRLQSTVGNPVATPATSVAPGAPAAVVTPPPNVPLGPPAPPAPQGMTAGMVEQQGAMAAAAPRMQPPGPVATPQMPPRAAPVPQQMAQAPSEVVRRIATMLMVRGMPREQAMQQAMAEVAKRGGH